MEELRRYLPDRIQIRSFSEFGIPSDSREAVAFAYLGHLCVNGRTGNVPSVTGAKGYRILGKITFPPL